MMLIKCDLELTASDAPCSKNNKNPWSCRVSAPHPCVGEMASPVCLLEMTPALQMSESVQLYLLCCHLPQKLLHIL